MNIVIDTSILQRDRGFLQSDILLIKKLAKLDLIKIHIPWIVFKESTSQNMEDVKIDIVHLDSIQFVDGIFYVSIDISGKFGIEYFMYKSDYYTVEEGRNISIIDNDWNKHYFLVYEIFDVRLSYQCSIEQDSVKHKEFEFETEQVIIEELNIIHK